MAAVDLLRLAWQAARDARPGLRDALLTLALAESGPNDRSWADRCWKRLIANRSDDLIAAYPSWEFARRDERIAARVAKLRLMFPPARVQRLLERGAVLRGAYTGRRPRMSILLDDLLGQQEPSAAHSSQRMRPATKPLTSANERRATGAPALTLGPRESGLGTEPTEGDNSVYLFYLTVLLAIALLLASTEQVSDRGSKAA